MKFGKEYIEFSKKTNNLDFTHKGDWQKQYALYILKLFERFKKEKALDYGCALGANTAAMKENGFEQMQGIDVSQDYVDMTPFKNIHIDVFDLKKLPYEDKSFLFIHSQQVLEHIPEEDLRKIVFPEFFRILKDGGEVYAATPFEYKPTDIVDDPTHISCFSTEKWESIAREAGFEVVTKEYVPQWENEPMQKQHGWHQMVFRKPYSQEYKKYLVDQAKSELKTLESKDQNDEFVKTSIVTCKNVIEKYSEKKSSKKNSK